MRKQHLLISERRSLSASSASGCHAQPHGQGRRDARRAGHEQQAAVGHLERIVLRLLLWPSLAFVAGSHAKLPASGLANG